MQQSRFEDETRTDDGDGSGSDSDATACGRAQCTGTAALACANAHVRGDERQTASSVPAASELLRDAIERRDTDAVRSLLASRHTRRCSIDCASLLATACRNGDVAIAQLLAQHRGAMNDASTSAQMLHSACTSGQYGIVKWLVTERLSTCSSDLECEDADGRTPLMIAAMRQHLGIVRLLSAAGASLTRLCDWDVDVALECAKRGHTNMLAFLFANGVSRCDPTGAPRVAHLLLAAIRRGHRSTVAYLVQRADVASPLLRSCVALAAQAGQTEIVELLCASGADANAVDVFRRMALFYAICHGDRDMLAVLLTYGADVNAPANARGASALHVMAKRGELAMLQLVEQRCSGTVAFDQVHGRSTPLDLAASRGHASVVQLLLRIRQGSSDCSRAIRIKNNAALAAAAQAGYLDVVKMLVASGAVPHGAVSDRRNRPSALVQAARHGHLDVVEYLCETARVGDADGDGSADQCVAALDAALCGAAYFGHAATLMYLLVYHSSSRTSRPIPLELLIRAVICGHCDVARVLLAHSSEFVTADALCHAALFHQIDAVTLLLARGASANAVYRVHVDAFAIELPPLAIAAATQHLAMVKRLIEHGADIEGVTDVGETALFLAAEKGYLDVVTYLVDACNANVNSANAAPLEFTPVDVAQSRGHDAVVAFLLKRGARAPEHSVLDYESYWDLSDDNIHDRTMFSLEQQRHIQYWDRKEALDLVFTGYMLVR